jgi:hypothetical protein
MPKKPPRNNPKARELRPVHTAGAGAAVLLHRITKRAGVQFPAGLQARLPPDLQGHVVDVLARDDELVFFADSAVWGARLRLWLGEHAQTWEGRRPIVRIRQSIRTSRSLLPGIDS